MKMSRYMLSGAALGYAVGCRMEAIQRAMRRAAKRAKRFVNRKLGLICPASRLRAVC